jgi:hypothetical protein
VAKSAVPPGVKAPVPVSEVEPTTSAAVAGGGASATIQLDKDTLKSTAKDLSKVTTDEMLSAMAKSAVPPGVKAPVPVSEVEPTTSAAVAGFVTVERQRDQALRPDRRLHGDEARHRGARGRLDLAHRHKPATTFWVAW